MFRPDFWAPRVSREFYDLAINRFEPRTERADGVRRADGLGGSTGETCFGLWPDRVDWADLVQLT